MSRRRRLAIVAAVLLAGLVLAGAALYRWVSQDNSDAIPPSLPGVVRYDVQHGRDHTKGIVQYPQTPPVGGPHNPKWQNCGFYGGTVQNELAVHSLEHGAVWVTYTSKADKADVDALAAKVKKTPYTLMSPYENQAAPLVLSAWGHQLTVKSASDPAVDKFFSSYVQGKQTPEPGASCTGGTMK
jgi:hypothetical protein